MAVSDQGKRAREVWGGGFEAKPLKLHPPDSSGNTSVTVGMKALPRQQETKREPQRPPKEVSVRFFYSQMSLMRRNVWGENKVEKEKVLLRWKFGERKM